ncbi:MAG: archease [Deltaproteobacteria bacterium]|nr:archease [Deltaproteobacteria bacterium]
MRKSDQYYILLDHTADIGIRVWGATPGALFIHAARGMLDIMLEHAPSAHSSRDRAVRSRVTITGEDLPHLLAQWLRHLLFQFDAHGEVPIHIHIVELSSTQLVADVISQPFDPAIHRLKTELKAVTYHQLSVEQVAPDRFEARIIFDV